MNELTIKNLNFSWSIYRKTVFENCHRKYFYQYYGAWESWNINADDQQKHIYVLKNIKTIKQVIVAITEKSLLESIRKQRDFKSNFNMMYFSEFAKLADDIIYDKWKFDPKCNNIFDIYYREKDLSKYDLIEDIKNEFSQFFIKFTESSLFENISKLEYLNFYDIKPFDFFHINELQIYCSPSLIYKKGSQINSINLGFSENSLKLELIKLYIETKMRVPQDRIISQHLNLNNFELEENRYSLNIEETITESANDMLSYLYDDIAYETNFAKTADDKICPYCKFREFCKKRS